MMRISRWSALALAFASVAGGSTALAQNYPPGYGGYGWHGWGGGASSGRTAAGLGAMGAGAGVAAAGAGQRNLDNSQARATNANTAMSVNNYAWQCQQRNNTLYWARQDRNLQNNLTAQEGIRQRILNNPEEADIFRGDTLNAILGEIMNPKVYAHTLDLAQKPLQSSMIKSLPLEYAAGGICYSLAELTDRETVPPIFARPEFIELRKTARATAAKLRDESTTQRQPNKETVKAFRATLDAVKKTLEGLNDVDAGDKFQAEKYLKALYGLTKLIDSPSYDIYLNAVDKEATAPLCELLIFMHSFNLQFGPAKDPATKEYYSMLYGTLSDLRQQVNPPPGEAAAAAANGPQRGDQAANFYGGMPYSHLGAPVPPPAPGAAQPN